MLVRRENDEDIFEVDRECGYNPWWGLLLVRIVRLCSGFLHSSKARVASPAAPQVQRCALSRLPTGNIRKDIHTELMHIF